jgi:hypothetical protein
MPACLVALSILGVAAGLAACGDDDGGESAGTVRDGEATLSRPEIRTIRAAQAEVAGYCARQARALAGQAPAPSPRDLEAVTEALDELGALAEEKPEAETPDGASVRLALGDIAENLEGTNCDPRLVERIDTILAGLPPG